MRSDCPEKDPSGFESLRVGVAAWKLDELLLTIAHG